MRRKLAYSNPVLTNSMAKLGSLPQGDWHVSKTGGKLFVGDTNWTRCAILDETVNEAEFHLDKTPGHADADAGQYHLHGYRPRIETRIRHFRLGGFRASSPHGPRRTSPVKAGGRR